MQKASFSFVLRTICGPDGRSIPCSLTPGSRLTELLWTNCGAAAIVTEEKQALYGLERGMWPLHHQGAAGELHS